jgi:phosphatidylserine synthase
MTLAAYYPFSQTRWYQQSLAYLDLQHQGLVVLTLLLAVLMVSNVKYPRFPPIGLRSARGIFGLLVHLGILLGAVLAPASFLFPLGLAYVAFGLVRTAVLGLMQPGEAELVPDERLVDTTDSRVSRLPLSRGRRARRNPSEDDS